MDCGYVNRMVLQSKFFCAFRLVFNKSKVNHGLIDGNFGWINIANYIYLQGIGIIKVNLIGNKLVVANFRRAEV